MQHDVALAYDARLGQRRGERRDGVITHRQDDDVDVVDPWRLAAGAEGQCERCGYAFLVAAVETDRVARLGQCESQSDSRATGPDEPDRAGRLLDHLLRIVEEEGGVFASVSRSCGVFARSASARARCTCWSSCMRRRNSTGRPTLSRAASYP